MRYRKLGRYGVKLSEVGLGGWLTHGRTLDLDATEAIVHRALDLGVNFFDTADAYHRGEAETALGKAVQGMRREDLVIATKCFFPMSDAPNDRGLSRKHVTESVHASLARLRTDYVDLMQFHRYDPETPVDETVRAIDDLVRQGKVLYWGVSEWSADQIEEGVRTAEKLNANPPASDQPIYNMLARGIEDEVLPTCARYGLGVVVFSPLAQGVLTGKYLPGQPPPAGSRGSDDTSNTFMGGLLTDEVLTRVQRLKAWTEQQGANLSQVALAWCLRRPELTSVIIGATSIQQLETNVAASGLSFDESFWDRADAILQGK